MSTQGWISVYILNVHSETKVVLVKNPPANARDV